MIQLHCGNSLDVIATLGDDSVDSIVTDPPYGLSFMGRKWDYDVPSKETWEQCFRVLKPGGHLLAFAGTRTQHRMAVNIEDAGFEIRDMIAWVYGSGFPKSQNVGKAIDKAAGAEHEKGNAFNVVGGTNASNGGSKFRSDHPDYVKPQMITPEAQQWDGWGTALKPALEPITVARKPFKGTVANNVLTHGTGAINIDGCRVNPGERVPGGGGGERSARSSGILGEARPGNLTEPHTAGRWPANLIHDGSDEVTQLFPHTTSGARKAGTYGVAAGQGRYGEFGVGEMPEIESSKGSAARFFYCAKANKKDRSEGNTHPTVKPTDLMAYLVRLITPPGGVVLDPFMGSGSTGKAAVREGFDFIGIEREEEYVAIASKRLQVIQRSIMASRSADQNG